MDFICLDKNFKEPIWLKPINIQWNAKFYECGDFDIQIPTETYKEEFAYVYCSGRKQTGIVNKVFQEETLSGKFTRIIGFFLERKLHNYVVYNTFYVKDQNICEACASLINTYCAREHLVIRDWGELGTNISTQVTGGYVDEILYELLRTQNMSYRLTYDFEKEETILEFVKGVDRTQSQSVNETITFSETLKNISNVVFTRDNSNYKNYAYIATGEDDKRIVVELDKVKEGEEKRELWVDARDLQESNEVTRADLLQMMLQRGEEKLKDYVDITNISFDLDTAMIEYTTDFDLGDKGDAIVESVNQSYEAEVTEAREVWKDNQHTVEIILGDKIPTKTDRLMKG